MQRVELFTGEERIRYNKRANCFFCDPLVRTFLHSQSMVHVRNNRGGLRRQATDCTKDVNMIGFAVKLMRSQPSHNYVRQITQRPGILSAAES